ncbi:MAG: hypothetical protein AAF845_07140 [Bacteroidota bacterium]
MPLRPVVLLVAALGLAGCGVPYAVGTTASTVAPREVEPSVMLQVASAKRDLDRDDEPASGGLSIGNEARLGLDDRSDIGIRLMGLGTVTATYKRRLAGDVEGDRGAALIVGGGVVGLSHLHAEATLVVSPGPVDPAQRITPYGGIRVQDLTAFGNDAVDTAPAVGAFLGGRFGWPDLAIAPEIGVFYSPSDLAGDDDLVVVPSVTVRGDRLRKALGL